MTDLDDDLLGEAAAELPGASADPSAAVLRVLASGDVREMVDTAARSQVRALIAKAVSKGVGEAITDDLLDHVRADAERLAGDEIERFLSTGNLNDADEPGVEGEGAGPDNYYPTVFAFVEEFLIKVCARPVRDQSSFRWCSQWYRHAEAVSRLTALWRAFEVLRLDPGVGPSTWWINHADPCMAALSDSAGVFARCSADTHAVHSALPHTPPPAHLISSGQPSN